MALPAEVQGPRPPELRGGYLLGYREHVPVRILGGDLTGCKEGIFYEIGDGVIKKFLFGLHFDHFFLLDRLLLDFDITIKFIPK